LEERKKIGEEKSQLDKDLEEFRIKKKPLDIQKNALLKETENIEKGFSVISERERRIEEKEREIEEKEALAETPKEKRRIEKERWKTEEKRQELEKRRWPWDEKLKEVDEKIKKVEAEYEEIEAQEQGLIQKQKEISEKEERIQIKIKSFRTEPKWDEQIITNHEVGHHVWFTKLSVETQRSWTKFWATNRIEMPTQYAKTNTAEGFAESYAYIQFNPHGVNPGVKKWFSKSLL